MSKALYYIDYYEQGIILKPTNNMATLGKKAPKTKGMASKPKAKAVSYRI